MTPPRPSRPRRSVLLAVALATALTSCGADDAGTEEARTPAPTATPAGEPAGPTPEATGRGAGDVEIDLSALASGDVAARSGPLAVQACLGGQCSEFEVDPVTAGQETLDLDTAGLAQGDETPVTVTIATPEGEVLVQHEETVTLGEGETTVTVDPDGDG